MDTWERVYLRVGFNAASANTALLDVGFELHPPKGSHTGFASQPYIYIFVLQARDNVTTAQNSLPLTLHTSSKQRSHEYVHSNKSGNLTVSITLVIVGSNIKVQPVSSTVILDK